MGKTSPRRKKAVLTERQKDEITMRLAMFDTASEVARDLEKQGITISFQAIAKYDPYTAGGYKKRAILFDTTRARFLKEISDEPIANRAYRIRRLGMLHHRALLARDLKEARMALEQAAKEVGDVYSKPNAAAAIPVIPIGDVDLGEFSPEEKRNMLADRLAQVFGGQGGSRTVQ